MTDADRSGRAFVFGDNIDTDVLAPGHLMTLSPQDLARHCLLSIDPDFVNYVQTGDFVVAGDNFGLGSSREQAAISLKLLGIAAIIAPSFARIFYRNALNVGLPALFCDDSHLIRSGDRLRVDPIRGTIHNVTLNQTLTCRPIPAHLMAMVSSGGLIASLQSQTTDTFIL